MQFTRRSNNIIFFYYVTHKIAIKFFVRRTFANDRSNGISRQEQNFIYNYHLYSIAIINLTVVKIRCMNSVVLTWIEWKLLVCIIMISNEITASCFWETYKNYFAVDKNLQFFWVIRQLLIEILIIIQGVLLFNTLGVDCLDHAMKRNLYERMILKISFRMYRVKKIYIIFVEFCFPVA